ncbi:hypothetical protein KBA01_27940 [Kozakia baliensis]|nr:hypothetical protein KBA01_27940 [Kozakia baliensis]
MRQTSSWLCQNLHQDTHGTKKTLTVIFNGDVVWHHTMNASVVKTGSGLF